jgi:putative transposase
MKRKRREYGAPLKAKVALEAIKERETISALANGFEVHPTLIGQWKKRLVEGAEALFADGAVRRRRDEEPDQAELYEQIGRLKMQLEWLKKKLPKSKPELVGLIDWDHEHLSIREQCRVLGVQRSRLYYEPVPESRENLRWPQQEGGSSQIARQGQAPLPQTESVPPLDPVDVVFHPRLPSIRMGARNALQQRMGGAAVPICKALCLIHHSIHSSGLLSVICYHVRHSSAA